VWLSGTQPVPSDVQYDSARATVQTFGHIASHPKRDSTMADLRQGTRQRAAAGVDERR
jgi:hypothetical protein